VNVPLVREKIGRIAVVLRDPSNFWLSSAPLTLPRRQAIPVSMAPAAICCQIAHTCCAVTIILLRSVQMVNLWSFHRSQLCYP